ncbi:Protein CBG26910 [Caenorhabditis briggsae]|uniref:Protein CBG26910 n=2 Tax=Caenorhabditis briggsae TaxID=6238 RepID=B6IEQ3_CAEBR|nr:Protein CBG26910 [Caenorhabditis briggsae]ULT86353.1 hypothetical protein L3Y34_006201 [Caenorhabditis briggsae]CAR98383.1 Protein CBG26910 [Caenorhabditis briggsae]
MMYFLRITFLSIISIYAVLGVDELNCIPAVRGNGHCVGVFRGAEKNILPINLSVPENIDKFEKNCEEFKKCSTEMKCGISKNLANTIDLINVFCEGSLCIAKMEQRNSTCFREVKAPQFRATDKEAIKISCKNIFDKYSCMEKEVTEVCGAHNWERFKKTLLATNELKGTCQLD